MNTIIFDSGACITNGECVIETFSHTHMTYSASTWEKVSRPLTIDNVLCCCVYYLLVCMYFVSVILVHSHSK